MKAITMMVFCLAVALGEDHGRRKPLEGEFAWSWEPGGFSFLEGEARVRKAFQLHAGMVTRREEGEHGHEGSVFRQGFLGLGPRFSFSARGWNVATSPWAGAAINGQLGLALGIHTAANHCRYEVESRVVFTASRREKTWQQVNLAAPLGEACVKLGPACIGAGIGRSGSFHPETAIKWRLKGGFSLVGGALRSHTGWSPLFGLAKQW